MKKQLLFLLLIGLSFTAFSQTKDSIPAKEAVNHYNETVKIYGTVSGGRWLESSSITLINIDGAYPNSALTLMMKDADRKKFTFAPETFLKGKKVLITGTVIEYKGKPEIIITEPAQLKMTEIVSE
jgi:micrococcal nuclease